MFKTETHLHTAESSPCSHIEAKEMIRKYKEAGYSTVFVTDHFQANTVGRYGDMSWAEKMDIFLKGYRNAKIEGDMLGINVLPGAEIGFDGSPNHYLVYGITKEFLDRFPELYTYGIEKFSEIARENGIIIVQAHPYRDGYCFPTPESVDGFEIYNSNPRHTDFSDRSAETAKEYHLYVSGGSDAHRNEDTAHGGIATESEIKTTADFISCLKNGNIEIIRA